VIAAQRKAAGFIKLPVVLFIKMYYNSKGFPWRVLLPIETGSDRFYLERYMVTKQVVIKNPIGLHARPAAQLVELCKKFDSAVSLQVGERKCDAKSIFSVLRCCIKLGETVDVSADGPDEQDALDKIIDFIDALVE